MFYILTHLKHTGFSFISFFLGYKRILASILKSHSSQKTTQTFFFHHQGQMMMTMLLRSLVLACAATTVLAKCPHFNKELKKWSETATWENVGFLECLLGFTCFDYHNSNHFDDH